MHNGFSNVSTTASDAEHKFELVQELARFVSSIELPPAAAAFRTTPMVNAILAELGESMRLGTRERGADTAAGRTKLRRRVIDAYLSEYEKTCRMYFKSVPVPCRHTMWAEEAAAISEKFGSELEFPQDTPPTVAGAMKMAWFNLARAQQRWAIWMCLGQMYHATRQARREGTEAAEANEYQAASNILLGEIRLMEKRALMFALLAGGEDAERARQWVMETALGPGMTVAHHLCLDARHPMSWSSDMEAAFRKDIAAAVSRPAN